MAREDDRCAVICFDEENDAILAKAVFGEEIGATVEACGRRRGKERWMGAGVCRLRERCCPKCLCVSCFIKR